MTSRLILAVLVAGLAAGAAAMGSLPPRGPKPSVGGSPTGGAVRCALVTRAVGDGVALEGRVEALAAVRGSYSLTVRAPGADIDSSGPFTARAGETLVLGATELSGYPAGLDAAMTLDVGGRTLRCPLQPL